MQIFRNFIAALILLGIATPSVAESLAGAYLSASHASMRNDYKAASAHYLRALRSDPENPYLLQNAMLTTVARGNVARGAELAEKLDQLSAPSQISDLLLLSKAIEANDFDAAARFLNQRGDNMTDLVRGLMAGWIELGRGKMGLAVEKFDAFANGQTAAVLGKYHKALAMASVGDFETADAILSGDENGNLRLNRSAMIAHAQILSQLERNADAIAFLDASISGVNDQELIDLRDRLQAGETVPYDFIENAQHGASEVFYTLADALSDESNRFSSLLYSRLAQFLRPSYTPAILLTADILRSQSQYELAIEIYTNVRPDDPMFLSAELGRADTLLDAGQDTAAIEVLRGLTRSHAQVPRVHMFLGDALRGLEKYEESRAAYRVASDLIETPQPNHWFLFYALGITSERLDDWELAEADFRRALELNPKQPLVLNYLGYSLVEKGLKLEEAQKMIEDAVAARPDSGFITDSLGWVFYKLGKYEEAVGPMERAAELLPTDPIINDHLGDVYWKVGREREARFQWRRALSFDPEEKEAERIRRKLDMGLDVVLEAEEDLAKTSDDAN